MADTIHYYFEKSAPRGSSHYYSLLYTPAPAKEIIIAVTALWDEIKFITVECSDSGVARIKLNWWLDEITRLAESKATHPLTHFLANHLAIRSFIVESFHTILQALLLPLDAWQFKTKFDLLNYADYTFGELWVLRARVLGETDLTALTHHRMIGRNLMIIFLLRNIRKLLGANIKIFPEELFNEYEITQFTANVSNNELQFFNALYDEVCLNIHDAKKSLTPQQKLNVNCNILFTQLELTLLAEIKNDGFKILTNDYDLTPLRKLWTAWRTKRHM